MKMKTSISPKRPVPHAARGATTLLGLVWLLTALVWPLLRWVIAMDCVYQMVRMLYYWDTPGTYAGFTFLAHFMVLIALNCFVTFGWGAPKSTKLSEP